MRDGERTEAASLSLAGQHSLRIRDYIHILLVTILGALVLKTCVVEAFRIPSASMENTLLAGDFLLVNKFIYGAKTPSSVPFLPWRIPQIQFPAFASPTYGDVVVFELPVYARDNGSPSNYVKRCVGLPGDTIRIVNRRLLVNGKEFPPTARAKPSARRIFPQGYGDSRIFPKGSAFNEDNYGPLAIPRRGDRLTLDARTFLYAKGIIEHEGHTAKLDGGDRVMVDGVPCSSYGVERNYFFMIGDNRDNSLDSRFWGFVPDDLIIGKAMMIYFSVDESAGAFPANVRWGRIGMVVR
jgi:signal peptidase I